MTDDKKTAMEIITRLRDHGFEAYVAGGAARDILAGEVPNDYDVVTIAPHEMVYRLFPGRKRAVVGISFKICIVDGVEVATYRKDASFDCEDKILKPECAESIVEDLERRDLTINAMAWCPVTKEVVDPFGGREDLKNGIIRFTRDPEARIVEDPCRIVRACRFKARLRGNFDPESLHAMKNMAETVRTVAPERLRLEIVKAMTLDYPSLFFNALRDIGVLPMIFPGLAACYCHDGGSHHAETIDVHFCLVGDSLPRRKPLLRLAGYLHDIGKPPTAELRENGLTFYGHERTGAELVEQELKALCFSLKEIATVKGLVRHHMRSIESTDKPKTVRRVLQKLNEDNVSWKDWLYLKIADAKGNLGKKEFSRKRIKGMVMTIRNARRPVSGNLALTIGDLLINGREVMEILNLEPGPAIGEVLASALEYVLDDPERNTPEDLITFVKALGAGG